MIASFCNENDFITINPKRNRPSSTYFREKIRSNFYKINDKIIFSIYIGKEVAKKISIKKGDKLSISYDKDNKYKFFIKKAKNGFTVTTHGKKTSSPAYRIILNFDIYSVPEEKITGKSKVVKSMEFKDDGIIFSIY